MADAGAGQGVLPAAQHLAATCAIPSSAPRCSGAAASARHDAVAWGYARGADALGVDIIQNCEVTGIRRDADGAVDRRRDHARRRSRTQAASASSRPATPAWSWRWPGVRMPLESYPAAGAGLGAGQAGVSLRGDVEHRARLHLAVRQGRAGHRRRHRPVRLLLARPAGCTSPRTRSTRSASCSRMFRRMQMLRNWGGIVDVTPDRSPILGKTPVPGPLRQLRLGHRRLQGDARLRPCLRPHHRHAASRTRSTRPSRSTASAPAG